MSPSVDTSHRSGANTCSNRHPKFGPCDLVLGHGGPHSRGNASWQTEAARRWAPDLDRGAVLRLIAGNGCERYTWTSGSTCWNDGSARVPAARFEDDTVCSACLARAALGGSDDA